LIELDQVPNAQDQRYLFTILRNLRFVTPAEISDLLQQAQSVVARVTPPMKRESKVEKRRDLLVTYVDGPAKSGAAYARAYAKEVGVLLDCVVEPSKIARKLEVDSTSHSALVIVDDFAGTGKTIADGLESFLEPISTQLQIVGMPVIVILLYATTEAQERIAKLASRFNSLRIEVYVGVELGPEARTFRNGHPGIWKDEDERDRAKALCIRLGTGLYKEALGFGSQSLLIAFPEGCPNNCLPILFASRSGTQPWNALLPRPVS
jgi:adenine/guanine phosphoribosyltransferase-like PRPP-binding protein